MKWLMFQASKTLAYEYLSTDGYSGSGVWIFKVDLIKIKAYIK
jgi:hypothetical protein